MNLHGRVAVVALGLLTGALVVAEQASDQPSRPNAEMRGATAPTASESPQVLSRNDLTDADIRKVQSALNEAGYNAGPVDGIWGDATDQALRDFQRAKTLDVTGQLDHQTILALGYSRADFAAAEAPPTLTAGDVRQVQEALNKAGYNVGSVDGVWGPATEAALRDFQQAKGLEPTGKINQDVVLALGLSPTDFAAGEFQENRPQAPAP